MESDLFLEVPDTPDRLAQLVNESSGLSSQRENFNVEVDPLSPSPNIRLNLPRSSRHLIPKDIGERDVSTRSTTLDDRKLRSSQGKLGQLMSETLVKKPFLRTPFEVGQSGVSDDTNNRVERSDLNHDMHPIPNGAICDGAKRKRRKGLLGESSELVRSRGTSALLGVGSSLPAISVGRPRSRIKVSISDKDNVVLQDDAHGDMNSRDKGKGVDLCRGSHSESHQELASARQTDVPQRPRGLRRLVRNGCISPHNIARTSIASEVHCQNEVTSDGQKCSSFARISDQDKLKGIDTFEDSHPINNNRKLVRNGCIFQNSSSEGLTIRQPTEDKLEETKFREAPKPNGASHQIHNVSPDSKCSCTDGRNGKGKAIADAFVMTNGQYGEANLPLSRPCGEAAEDVAIYEDGICDILGFKDLGWRRTHNSIEKESAVSLSDTVGICKREAASGHQSDQSNEVGTGTDVESRRKRNKEGKRKFGTSNSNGESSSSVSDVTEVSYLGTSWRPSKSRSTRTRNPREHGIVLGPVIEVDELHSPEVRSSNLHEQSHNVSDSCNARARQVESDELLAQQLQEQLYNESPGIRDREQIDAAIAWSLQQEENAQRASLASGQTQYSRRERLLARLNSQRPPRNSLSRSVNSGQYGSRRTTRMMRDVDFSQMDINMRSGLLEELGAGMNSINGIAFSNILHIQRDFNENDYETLLALDNNNHQHTGASENQINNLPQSTVQTDNVEEPCAVCLEKPSIGDIIRHLPCLHKFHKDCIDQWLRRKTACPVCKSGIT